MCADGQALRYVATLMCDQEFEQIAEGVACRPGMRFFDRGAVQVHFAGHLKQAKQAFGIDNKRFDDFGAHRFAGKIVSFGCFIRFAVGRFGAADGAAAAAFVVDRGIGGILPAARFGRRSIGV